MAFSDLWDADFLELQRENLVVIGNKKWVI